MSALLEIEDLHVAMGSQQILRGIDLTLAEGEMLAVLGANGVGKTTLMRTLSGIYRARSGRVVLAGRDITNAPAHRIVAAGLAQSPEGRQIFSAMTVRENLILGGGRAGLAELDAVLPLFPRLGERMAQLAGSLSGGEQQMLCIARALMARPRVLLLDEPSLGLAPKLVRNIFELLARIRAQGVSILVVEQNARAALKVADRAAVMEGGRIALAGAAAALAEDPRIVAAYLGGHV
ncbi:branched chain amino acid/phenylalanine ABC transporter ATP binding subunit LivF [Rhodovastum atsumiense]|uniref:ABC transporter ATP-binding protein n=1 Tax=Rhodovastum atsumiense TaxID=504468 RepID=A0A5M6IN08_9PROT|nr:ABC transporter ATP-binding protein [Rhodovastum atsumiense]KAA5609259.1 ABC transporter ATP-binding protein [Rhodovastum atsumiense]CAH2601713.1 branched chain amino acid/phenylalanine ABC transporter ATP binding subunit LivF [Rhodovastum atsumiense]